MTFRSIATQLQLWHCAFPSLVGVTLLTIFYYFQKELLTRDLDLGLKSRMTAVLPFAEKVVSSFENGDFVGLDESLSSTRGNIEGLTSANAESQVSAAIDDGYSIRIFSKDRQLIWQSKNAPDLPLPEIVPSKGSTEIHKFHDYREAIHAVPQSHLVTIGISAEALSKTLSQLGFVIACIAVALISMGWTIGYLITRRALRPLETISETARSISTGKRGQRINVNETKNELGTLAAVLNESFERQDAAFDQQVQFLADASHELRTPIAVILAKSQLGQLYPDQEKRLEALAICESAAKHMRELIESLLDLSRLDSGAVSLEKFPCELAAVARKAIALLQPLADEKGVSIQTDFDNEIFDFDRQRIRQVVINILSNAIKYNLPNDGWIKVTGKSENDQFRLCIENSGKTISADDLPHLFNRFYRADKSRTKTREGSAGLGLAITKAIVEAHDGRISATSAEGVTTVQVKLPLSS